MDKNNKMIMELFSEEASELFGIAQPRAAEESHCSGVGEGLNICCTIKKTDKHSRLG